MSAGGHPAAAPRTIHPMTYLMIAIAGPCLLAVGAMIFSALEKD